MGSELGPQPGQWVWGPEYLSSAAELHAMGGLWCRRLQWGSVSVVSYSWVSELRHLLVDRGNQGSSVAGFKVILPWTFVCSSQGLWKGAPALDKHLVISSGWEASGYTGWSLEGLWLVGHPRDDPA